MVPEDFAERLRRLMFERGIESAAELGRRIGVSGQTVTRWLSGTPIAESNLRVLAAELGVNWLWLGYGEEAGVSETGEYRDMSPFGHARRELIRRALDNERRLRLAQELSGFGAWEVELLSGTLTWDEQTCRLFQLSPTKAPRTPEEFFRLVHRDDLQALKTAVDAMLATPGKTFEAEYRYLRPDGQLCWFRDRARLTRDEAGTPLRIIGASLDITTERRARERAARYERIREHMLDSYAEVAIDGTILDITEGALQMGGWTRRELVGKDIRDFYADPSVRDRLIAELEAQGAIYNFPAMLLAKDGTRIPVLYNARLVRDERGQPAYIAGTMRPARATTEEQRKAACFDNMDRYLMTRYIEIDPAGIITSVAEGFVDVDGWDRERLVGHDVREFHVDKTAHDRFMVELVKTGTLYDYSLTTLQADGSPIELLVSANLVRNGQGKPLFVAATLRAAHPEDLPHRSR